MLQEQAMLMWNTYFYFIHYCL